MRTRPKPQAVTREGRQLDTKQWRTSAIDPRAFDGWYSGGYTPTDATDGIAVVSVCGPLDHHQGWWLDSYDSIVCRVGEAFADETVKAVVLCFDSPGGDASGVEEAHRAIRRMRADTGKPLFAYSNESCYSAAYWLACAADEIWLPPTGGVGSVGVIAEAVDVTGANDKAGVRIELVTSGTQKADGHPERPLTDDILGRVQARVDKLASIFFASVAASRRIKPAAVAALQAGTFLGDDAIAAGLADGIAGFDDFLDTVRSAVGVDTGKIRATPTETSMAKKLLALTAAVTAAQKALGAAKTDDELATASKALTAALDAKVKYSKRTRTDEVEEDDGEESSASSEAPSTKRSSEMPSSSGAAESAEAESAEAESAEAESASESAEAESADGDDDAKRMKSRAVKAMRGRPMTAAAVYDAIVSLTGKRNLNEAVGALAGIKASLAEHRKLAKSVAKLESDARASKVTALIERAQAQGRLGKDPKQVAQLRAQGLKDPDFLKGYLATLPKRVHTVEDGPIVPKESQGAAITSFESLPPAQQEIIKTGARASGMALDEYFKKFQANFAAFAPRAGSH